MATTANAMPTSGRAPAELVHRPGEPGYEDRRSGFNLAVRHHPELIVDAASPADVIAAVELAGRTGRAVGVMNTGHGPSVPADGAVLIRTGRMRRVEVDPARRTARVEAGAAWGDVIAAAAHHGLAPLNGTSPHVGVVGYTLGGGVGLLGRRYGFAADHVLWVDVVTADGRLRHVAPGDPDDPDLFWALRGAGGNFGVVTAMEFDLFPVAGLLGGELCFGPDVSDDVVAAYVAWAAAVPDTVASSLLLLAYPDDPAVDAALRGRHVTHVRVAYSGDDLDGGRRWVDALRRVGPRLLDTVRAMPYADVGSIHHEPVDVPVAAYDRNVLLGDLDGVAAAVLSRHAGPAGEGGFLAELRAWGGALSRPPAPPNTANAVGGRDAAFSLLGIADPSPGPRSRRDALLAAMRPWSTGRTYPNFSGVEDTSVDAVRRGYRPRDFARLRHLKAAYDPDNVFRVNFNIPPEGSES